MNNIIALTPVRLNLIEIQTTLFIEEEKTYLNSVNIIFESRIIKKIKIRDEFILNNEKNINEITRKYFLDTLCIKKRKNYNKGKRKKAASNLMDELNLFKTKKYE
jgi:hypothetical protein|tara:strand:- start:1594 stop:1908 length:315 start_codon:yes stop_codon:yes gene_type:complete